MHHAMSMGRAAVPASYPGRPVGVVATLSKGYDLDYIWKQVDRDPARDAASYCLQATRPGPGQPSRNWPPLSRVDIQSAIRCAT
jgi:hypothetical protein